MKYLRLWTLQHKNVWYLLQKHGVLFTDENLLNYRSGWTDTHDWMREQMKSRIPSYPDVFPWWAWYYPKPDLRYWRHQMGEGSECFVRIEMLIPAEQVLLSASSPWSMVINRDFIAYTRDEQELWNVEMDRLEAQGIDQWWPLPEPHSTLVRRSWKRIFDIAGMRESDNWGGDVVHIQATFPVLKMEYVTKVTPFIGRE